MKRICENHKKCSDVDCVHKVIHDWNYQKELCDEAYCFTARKAIKCVEVFEEE